MNQAGRRCQAATVASQRGPTGLEDGVPLTTATGGHCPIISLASTKGGVGKTTLAYVLATELARRFAAVRPATGGIACIDADPNRTLSQVLRLTADPVIACIESDGEQLLGDLRSAVARSALVLIDLEGTANQAMLYAAGKSDLVLVPAQPSRFDVVEAIKTIGVVRKAADLVGRDIAHRVVLSRTPVLRQRVADHSRAQFLRAGLPLLPVELVQRTAFQTMTYTGEPPFRQAGAEAAAENIARLANEVLNTLGIMLPEETAVSQPDLPLAREAPAGQPDVPLEDALAGRRPHLRLVETVA